MSLTIVSERLDALRLKISLACDSCVPPRDAAKIRLLAVTKKQSVALLRVAYKAGMRDFGENYVREAREKKAATADLAGCVWHLIGHLQSNKTNAAAKIFDWVHSISGVRTARKLGEARLAAKLPDINICVQVNFGFEQSKSGAAPGEIADLCAEITRLPGLCLRGLMCIPESGPGARQRFAQLCKLKELCARRCTKLDTLSMGMSADFGAAVAEGATIVRIGTALFGPRTGLKATSA